MRAAAWGWAWRRQVLLPGGHAPALPGGTARWARRPAACDLPPPLPPAGVTLADAKGVVLLEFCEGRDLFHALDLVSAGTGQRIFGWHERGQRVAFDVAKVRRRGRGRRGLAGSAERTACLHAAGEGWGCVRAGARPLPCVLPLLPLPPSHHLGHQLPPQQRHRALGHVSWLCVRSGPLWGCLRRRPGPTLRPPLMPVACPSSLPSSPRLTSAPAASRPTCC